MQCLPFWIVYDIAYCYTLHRPQILQWNITMPLHGGKHVIDNCYISSRDIILYIYFLICLIPERGATLWMEEIWPSLGETGGHPRVSARPPHLRPNRKPPLAAEFSQRPYWWDYSGSVCSANTLTNTNMCVWRYKHLYAYVWRYSNKKVGVQFTMLYIPKCYWSLKAR